MNDRSSYHPLKRLRHLMALIGFLVLTISVLPHPALAADPPTQPLDLVYEIVGEKVNVQQNGAGVFGVTEADVVMDVPGTAIRKAYLIWAGLGQDDTVQLARDGGLPVNITADMVWNNNTVGFPTWGCCGGELSSYASDITNLGVVRNGSHTYTVSEMAVTAGDVVENWGYSLVVIYEDESIETVNDVIVKLGNDGFHFRWRDDIGPNSDVQCVVFPRASEDRIMDFTVVVGGIKDIYRPNGLWGRTGNENYLDLNVEGGTWNQNVGLIDGVSGITGIGGSIEVDGPLDGDFTDNGVDRPFTDNRGDQWDLYPVFKIALDSEDTWACVQIESANRPEISIGEGTDGLGASIGFLGLVAVFESNDQPDIDIEKATNGEDADDPTGPQITVGGDVTWTYEVTNIGVVTLTDVVVTDDRVGTIDCPKDSLEPDESMTCIATGTATVGQYENLATVSGESPTGVIVTDEDPSHYFGVGPGIDIEKATNGQDADDPPGPKVEIDSTVIWTYVVTNIGNVPLTDVIVTDDKEGIISCPKDTLDVNEVMTCELTGIAGSQDYENQSMVVGTAPDASKVSDDDPSHYSVEPTGIDDENEPDARTPSLFIPMATWLQ